MERLGEYVKHTVKNFKLELCCFFASVRTGVLIFACINIILGFTFLIALAEGGFAPPLQQALDGLSSGDEKFNFKPTCIVAYSVELASSVVLLCAMIRNDVVLLRAYMYYSLGVLVAAVMVYSVVIGAVAIPLELLIVASVVYQCYLILLVRSAMVEIKHAPTKNGYTVNFRPNVEAPCEPGPREKYSVVIETDGRKPPVATLVKKDLIKPVIVAKEPTVSVVEIKPELPPKGLVKTVKSVKPPEPVKVEITEREVKKEEIKKPTRSFFGKKEKVKVGEQATTEKTEETKKV